MFGNFKELARALFELTKYMKNQDKRKVDDFVELLIDLLVINKKVFPDEPCPNKLHFFMWHLVPFVARWETVGFVSSESHEYVHARFEKQNKL